MGGLDRLRVTEREKSEGRSTRERGERGGERERERDFTLSETS